MQATETCAVHQSEHLTCISFCQCSDIVECEFILDLGNSGLTNFQKKILSGFEIKIKIIFVNHCYCYHTLICGCWAGNISHVHHLS